MSLAYQPVSLYMRQTFIDTDPQDSLLQAAQIMQLARIRHLPVTKNQLLVGIISHRDIMAAALPPFDPNPLIDRFEQLRSLQVSCIMHTTVWTLGPDATLGESAEHLLRHKVGCLPIVRSVAGSPLGEMLGLLTESDLLAAAYTPNLDPRTLINREPASNVPS